MTTLSDIQKRRNLNKGGFNPHAFIKLFGGKLIHVSYVEPNPQTTRCEFYYNARINKLFKRIKINDNPQYYAWKQTAMS